MGEAVAVHGAKILLCALREGVSPRCLLKLEKVEIVDETPCPLFEGKEKENR